MTDEQDVQPSPGEQERKAIDLIARTPEGRLLHRYLRRVLEAVFDVEDSGALRTHTGRRTLARDLMRLMADGIEATRDRNAGSSDDPILTRAGAPVRTGRGYASVRDYVTAAERADNAGSGTDGPGNTRAARRRA